MVDLKHPSCAESVVRAVERDPQLQAMSTAELASVTEEHVVSESGAGGALAFVALLGLVVGAVIVGQTQFALVREHLRELGMLRAVGATRAELAAFVAWQAAFVALAGGASGIALALLLQKALAGRSVELVYGTGTLALGACAVVVMCGAASAFSLATVLRLDVAKVLQ